LVNFLCGFFIPWQCIFLNTVYSWLTHIIT
jgi:hypothetical protein